MELKLTVVLPNTDWHKQAPDMIKMLIKYALCDWIKQSEMHYDNRKMYFISFERRTIR